MDQIRFDEWLVLVVQEKVKTRLEQLRSDVNASGWYDDEDYDLAIESLELQTENIQYNWS